MARFPGRFPNEILDDLDHALLARITRAKEIEWIEARRAAFLSPPGAELTTAEWEAIREHDRLVGDMTVKVITQ